ncbi:unnamed protein product [Rangifer tarandus platyrhynchus]|uniref:Uncharacterized protein n=2 Tax=Rangifer tarandus platyrhynchus TaxID=3082113 RepID=A0AC59YUS7_RANTA|nr:unnamed protein product [Rangifer tarandus platyrhynchus]
MEVLSPTVHIELNSANNYVILEATSSLVEDCCGQHLDCSLVRYELKDPAESCMCCRKGDPFQGPKLGSYLTLGNELSEETHGLANQEILLGTGTRAESRRDPGELLCHVAHSLGFYGDGVVSGLSLANHSDSVLPGGACLVQPRWIPVRSEGVFWA